MLARFVTDEYECADLKGKWRWHKCLRFGRGVLAQVYSSQLATNRLDVGCVYDDLSGAGHRKCMGTRFFSEESDCFAHKLDITTIDSAVLLRGLSVSPHAVMSSFPSQLSHPMIALSCVSARVSVGVNRMHVESIRGRFARDGSLSAAV
jgi:hypothetical protein